MAFLIVSKSDVCTIFIQFQSYVERCFNHSPHKLLQQLGISHRLSYRHTHQQNGSIERKHHHIVEIGLDLISLASVALHFWDDAFVTTCYLITPTPTLHNVTF